MVLRILVAIVALVVVAGGAAYVLAQQEPAVGSGLAPVPVTKEAARSFDTKAQALVDAADQVKRTGKAQPFEVTFTEAELTSKTGELARSLPDFPYTNTQVHIAGSDVVITSTATLAGIPINVGVVATPTVVDGKLQVVVKRVDTGALPLGAALRSQIEAQLQQALDWSRAGLAVDFAALQVADGKIVAKGQLNPPK